MIWSTSVLAAVTPESALQGGGVSWWQTVGGLLVVFGLLMVSLKMLGKLNRRSGGGEANVLAVWPLGPRREIQVLRLGAEVHYIYRHESAMVLLRQESLADFERTRQNSATAADQTGLKRFLPGRLPLPRVGPRNPGAAPDLTSL